MEDVTKIKFIDLRTREQQEIDRLTSRRAYLAGKKEKRNANLPSDEEAELKRLNDILNLLNSSPENRIDALFVAVRELFNAKPALISSSGNTRLCTFDDKGTLLFNWPANDQVGDAQDALKKAKQQVNTAEEALKTAEEEAVAVKKKSDESALKIEVLQAELTLSKAVLAHKDAEHFLEKVKAAAQPGEEEKERVRAVATISLVLGILAADQIVPPRVMLLAPSRRDKHENHCYIVPDTGDHNYLKFVDAFYKAIGEASAAPALASTVLSILDAEGDPNGDPKAPGEVECIEFARVVRCLIKREITAPVPQLRRRVNECLNKIQQVGEDKPLSDIGISLPDLDQVSNYQIQEENVRLMGPIICAAMFEELKVFQVIDKLVEQSQNGMLVTSRGPAGEMLYKYWKDTPNRMSESERANLYALTIGIPGGDGAVAPNREFNDLWARFVSSVSSLVRQRTTDSLLRATLPAGVSQQQVRKAARDLALNLSSRGYGMALYLAIDLQNQINMMINLLNDQEIKGIYGARDMWQVIDQVAILELGGARNSARYKTLAKCGAIITAWLANNIKKYNSSTSRIIIDLDEVMSIDPPASSEPTKTPTDYDLVNACEQWLADTATSDERIEELSQPREAPMMTSRPVQIPSVARDMLESAGVAVPGFGMGAGMMHR